MSRRALAALLALVAALGLVVLFDRPAARFAPRDERLFPELTGGSVSRLTLQRRGGPAVIVERRGAGWTVNGAPADEAAVRELVNTLASLAVRRQVPPAAARGLDPPRLMVELTGGSGTHRLAIGDPDPALGRAWARRLEIRRSTCRSTATPPAPSTATRRRCGGARRSAGPSSRAALSCPPPADRSSSCAARRRVWSRRRRYRAARSPNRAASRRSSSPSLTCGSVASSPPRQRRWARPRCA